MLQIPVQKQKPHIADFFFSSFFLFPLTDFLPGVYGSGVSTNDCFIHLVKCQLFKVQCNYENENVNVTHGQSFCKWACAARRVGGEADRLATGESQAKVLKENRRVEF